jgi:hypothetical protein
VNSSTLEDGYSFMTIIQWRLIFSNVLRRRPFCGINLMAAKKLKLNQELEELLLLFRKRLSNFCKEEDDSYYI